MARPAQSQPPQEREPSITTRGNRLPKTAPTFYLPIWQDSEVVDTEDPHSIWKMK
jgi:hypothetical protein